MVILIIVSSKITKAQQFVLTIKTVHTRDRYAS